MKTPGTKPNYALRRTLVGGALMLAGGVAAEGAHVALDALTPGEIVQNQIDRNHLETTGGQPNGQLPNAAEITNGAVTSQPLVEGK